MNSKLTGVNKYMPKRYEDKYREFKEAGKNLRTAMNVNTFIHFTVAYAFELTCEQSMLNYDDFF